MPHKTAGFGLNQWEGTDQFLRTDFNDDNAAVDAALMNLQDKLSRSTTNATEQLQLLTLALQDLYMLADTENYYLGEKRGLLFDSFASRNKLQSETLGISMIPEEKLVGMGTDYAPLDDEISFNAVSFSLNTPYQYDFHIGGCGTLNSCSFNMAASGSRTITLKIYHRTGAELGDVVYSTTQTVTLVNTALSLISFALNQSLTYGDYTLMLTCSTSSVSIYSRNLYYSAINCTAGTMLSIPFQFSNFADGNLLGYVRHNRGNVAMTLIAADGTRQSIPLLGTEDSCNVDGAACLMSHFSLEGCSGLGDSFQVELAFDGGSSTMCAYNYGLVFI